MKILSLICLLMLGGCRKGPSISDKAQLLAVDKTTIDQALQIMGKPDTFSDHGSVKFWYYKPFMGENVTVMFMNETVASVRVY